MLFHGYDKEQKAFGSLLGISYYLKKVDFEQLVMASEGGEGKKYYGDR